MRFVFTLSLTLLTLSLCQTESQARGRGVRSFLLDAKGQLTAEIGETSGDLIDPAAFVRYRYHDGRVIAAPLDKPDMVLWSANVNALMKGRGPAWQLLPTLIVILGENTITGVDRATGKVFYTTPSEHFTDSPASVRYTLEENPPSLYMIDDRALREQLRRDLPNSHPPATLARFDLSSGKFLWKTSIITPAGLKLRPMGLDPRGLIRGENDDEEFYFDPATGKALDKLPPPDGSPLVDPFANTPQPKPGELSYLNNTAEKIIAFDVTHQKLWERAEPGEKAIPCLTADSLLIPIVTERATVQLLALNKKDGSERWRTPLPLGKFADQVTVEIKPAKTGYLVNVEWTVLD
jgi:hypothetical protein